MPAPRLLAALAALLVALPACGRDDDEREVRDTLEQFAAATARKDYQQLCDRLFAPELVEQVRRVNLPCEVALRTGLGEVQRPTLTVQRVVVDGDNARADVRSGAANQPPSRDVIRLVKRDDGWRIASLATPRR